MKRILMGTIVIAFLVSACATTPNVIPAKYNLDEYLEPVGQISLFKVSDCVNVDNQAIILEADRDKYYLLVLRRPIDVEYANQSIGIENTSSKDKARSTQEIIGSKTTAGSGPNTEFVQAPSNITRIVSGHDRVIVADMSTVREYYVIEKIYKLKGREQAGEIKELLRKN